MAPASITESMVRVVRRKIIRRDDFLDDDDDYWYYSEEGRSLRYGIFFAILLAFFWFIIGSYLHARNRLKRGLAPLKYHRWLLSKRDRSIHEPRFREPDQNLGFYVVQRQQQQQQQPTDYYMHAVPPPVYNPNYVQPPPYSQSALLPENATKVHPTAEESTNPVAGSSNPFGGGSSNNGRV